MLSLDDIKFDLIEQFNSVGDIHFNIYRYQEQFYNNDIYDKDNKPYVAGVLHELEMPRIETFYTTRRREFELLIKGRYDYLDTINEIIKDSEQFKVDDTTYYLSNVNVFEVKVERLRDDIQETVKVFYGRIRLGISIPTFITGKDIKIKIDDVNVDVVNGVEVFDKAMLSSVDFGDNESDINTGSEHTFRFTLDANPKKIEIFNHIISKKYNKTFTFNIDYVVSNITIDLALRSGNIIYTNNDNAIQFEAVFTRPLARRNIMINDKKVEAISFTRQYAINPVISNAKGVVKQGIKEITNTYTFMLSNDNGDTINDIILESKESNGKKFVLEFEENNITFNVECILTNLLASSSENPNAVYQVVMGEGAFYE